MGDYLGRIASDAESLFLTGRKSTPANSTPAVEPVSKKPQEPPTTLAYLFGSVIGFVLTSLALNYLVI